MYLDLACNLGHIVGVYYTVIINSKAVPTLADCYFNLLVERLFHGRH